jgi:hypothetical protein
MFFLIVKDYIDDGGHESAWLSVYTSLDEIRAQREQITQRVKEEFKIYEDDENGVSYVDRKVRLFIQERDPGLNMDNDMMTALWHPQADMEGHCTWHSDCKYLFGGTLDEFNTYITTLK